MTVVAIVLLVYYLCNDSLGRLIDKYYKPIYISG